MRINLSKKLCFKELKNLLNLTDEQRKLITDTFNKYIEEETKKSVSKLDKALDIAVQKLVSEGWTLPAELPIAVIYALEQTTKLDNVNDFMESFYSTNDYKNMKDMIIGIQESKIKPGLIKLTTECWQAFLEKSYAMCATALLSVIEGILCEFCDDKTDVKMMMVCQKHCVVVH